jgi:replicative DNA helicase
MGTFDKIEKLYANKGSITGVPTGFNDLDNMLTGLQNADLVIIAARPSMGKTSLVLNMAQYAAVHEKIPIGIFSLEMPADLLAQRMLCAEANLDAQRLRRGILTDQDWPRLTHALGRLSEAPIYIDDSPTITVTEMRAKARRLKAERGLGMIAIDYLQLITSKGRNESRQQEIAEVTRSLKAMARELNVPVVALAQLSRAVEATADKRPMLSHLKESGEIEASADVVSFIFREDYYNPDTERKGIAEIIIAKHRNGPTGTVELGWNNSSTKFFSLDKYHKDA